MNKLAVQSLYAPFGLDLVPMKVFMLVKILNMYIHLP